jgi:hypothetical protein
MPNPNRSIPAALTLFFIAPLVAEYLLGDFPITLLSPLILMTPFYGGGALLIRELARRTGRGWPTILLLGVAYALIEEGYTTQTLFNTNAIGLHLHLLTPAWIPALGTGAWWTLFMLNVHPFWSIGVSIALVEGLFPSRDHSPWLGNIGLSVAALLFVLGGCASTAYSIRHYHFVASTTQFTVTGIVCVLFVVAAFLVPTNLPHTRPGAAPSPWLSGLAAFLLGFVVFLAPVFTVVLAATRGAAAARMNFFDPSNANLGWVAVAWILVADLLFLLPLWFFSRRKSWTALHTFSIGAAGALVYGVHAFMGKPVVPAPKGVVLLSHVLCLVLALVVGALGVRQIKAFASAGASATPVAPA